jgi:plasminogen activator inhibitor 1 RNA-binding protein
VIAMQAVPATEASQPAMILEEEIDLRVLRAPTMAVDEAVEAIATLTDTAGELEGEDFPDLRVSSIANTFSDSEKQAGHGWGANEGGAELADEQAGEAIANAEQKEALTTDGDAAPTDAAEPAAEPEPEDNSISYTDYLAQLAEKKLALGSGVPEARKPNEGTKQDKKWANAKPIAKEEEEDFVAGSGGKAKRERERKQKQLLEIDQRFVEAPERGRGGFRGGRGRGDGPPRGGRGDGGFRGGRGGEGRGGRARGGDHRGGGRPSGPRGGSAAASINTEDTSAFPSLGS